MRHLCLHSAGFTSHHFTTNLKTGSNERSFLILLPFFQTFPNLFYRLFLVFLSQHCLFRISFLIAKWIVDHNKEQRSDIKFTIRQKDSIDNIFRSVTFCSKTREEEERWTWNECHTRAVNNARSIYPLLSVVNIQLWCSDAADARLNRDLSMCFERQNYVIHHK